MNKSEKQNIHTEFQKIASEVEQLIDKYKSQLESTSWYKGTQILYSNIIYKPTFMLIGYNPGSGFFRTHGTFVNQFDELEELEYLDESYQLADETKQLFQLADCSKYLNNTVKTNWSFLATNRAIELDWLMNKFLYEYDENLYTQSHNWLKRIIELVRPKVIICEGKAAFGKVTCNIFNSSTQSFDGYDYSFAESIHIIGYARTYSRIRNKRAVADKIQEILSAS